MSPVHVYPLYENATTAAWGLTPAAALAESGAAYQAISEIAATNPAAWGRKAFTAAQITHADAENRMIAWPYTKRMVANNTVNQAGAVLMTTLAIARAAGIAEDRIVHVHGGAAAAEPMDYLARDQFDHSVAQNAVLGQAMRIAPDGFDRVFIRALCIGRAQRARLCAQFLKIQPGGEGAGACAGKDHGAHTIIGIKRGHHFE